MQILLSRKMVGGGEIKGVTEYLNNKIIVIRRVSYGYCVFYHLRNRTYVVQRLFFSQSEAI